MNDQIEAYTSMCRIVRGGGRLPAATVRRVLNAASKTPDDYLTDTCPGTADRAMSGDPCDCGARLVVIDSRVIGGRRVRRLGCKACGHREGRKLVTNG